MKGCRRKYKLHTQIHLTKSETRYKKKIKKEQSHCAWFSGFPLQQNEKRRALQSSINQIDGVLSRIFIHSHCKARSHNAKGGCTCREKKKSPLFRSHILCPRFENNYVTKLDYRKWE